eukprot:MONOS_1123.1-p1 / transcript=MONOS_1123.1 / gene=MONOS_1123 / organism=Monocercomonoides_exilis_PA203 / gene_product=unspecified product / transcript_product=unspecified product / location=Mono_scaffold00019:44506-52427(+) / protein_length=2565 / sequence_SO=supercontig / SO=protein_coding / is_pseudo=false
MQNSHAHNIEHATTLLTPFSHSDHSTFILVNSSLELVKLEILLLHNYTYTSISNDSFLIIKGCSHVMPERMPPTFISSGGSVKCSNISFQNSQNAIPYVSTITSFKDNIGSFYLEQSSFSSFKLRSVFTADGTGTQSLIRSCTFKNMTIDSSSVFFSHGSVINKLTIQSNIFLKCESAFEGGVTHGLDNQCRIFTSSNNSYLYCTRGKIHYFKSPDYKCPQQSKSEKSQSSSAPICTLSQSHRFHREDRQPIKEGNSTTHVSVHYRVRPPPEIHIKIPDSHSNRVAVKDSQNELSDKNAFSDNKAESVLSNHEEFAVSVSFTDDEFVSCSTDPSSYCSINQASCCGGAIYARPSQFDQCALDHSSVDFSATRCNFSDCWAQQSGGAIALICVRSVSVSECNFIEDYAETEVGGGIWIDQVARSTSVRHCVFTECDTGYYGSALGMNNVALDESQYDYILDDIVFIDCPGLLMEFGAVLFEISAPSRVPLDRAIFRRCVFINCVMSSLGVGVIIADSGNILGNQNLFTESASTNNTDFVHYLYKNEKMSDCFSDHIDKKWVQENVNTHGTTVMCGASKLNPCDSIHFAFETSQANTTSTLRLMEDSFTENETISVGNRSIVVKGESREQCKVKPQSLGESSLFSVTSGDLHVDQVTFHPNAAATASSGPSESLSLFCITSDAQNSVGSITLENVTIAIEEGSIATSRASNEISNENSLQKSLALVSAGSFSMQNCLVRSFFMDGSIISLQKTGLSSHILHGNDLCEGSCINVVLENCQFEQIEGKSEAPSVLISASSSSSSSSYLSSTSTSSFSLASGEDSTDFVCQLRNASFSSCASSSSPRGGAFALNFTESSQLHVENVSFLNCCCSTENAASSDRCGFGGGLFLNILNALQPTDSTAQVQNSYNSLVETAFSLNDVSFSMNNASVGRDMYIMCHSFSDQLSSSMITITFHPLEYDYDNSIIGSERSDEIGADSMEEDILGLFMTFKWQSVIASSFTGKDGTLCGRTGLPCATMGESLVHFDGNGTSTILIRDIVVLGEELKLSDMTVQHESLPIDLNSSVSSFGKHAKMDSSNNQDTSSEIGYISVSDNIEPMSQAKGMIETESTVKLKSLQFAFSEGAVASHSYFLYTLKGQMQMLNVELKSESNELSQLLSKGSNAIRKAIQKHSTNYGSISPIGGEALIGSEGGQIMLKRVTISGIQVNRIASLMQSNTVLFHTLYINNISAAVGQSNDDVGGTASALNESKGAILLRKCYNVTLVDCVFDAAQYMSRESKASNAKFVGDSDSVSRNQQISNSHQNADPSDSDTSICSWSQSFIHFSHCTAFLLNTTFANSASGALAVTSSSVRIRDVTFAENGPKITDFPSLRRNIICEGDNSSHLINVVSMSTTISETPSNSHAQKLVKSRLSSFARSFLSFSSSQSSSSSSLSSVRSSVKSTYSPSDSLWIQNNGCRLYGIAAELPSCNFIPSLNSIEPLIVNSSLSLNIKGELLLPCGLSLVIVTNTSGVVENVTIPLSSPQFYNEAHLSVLVPLNVLPSSTDSTVLSAKIAYPSSSSPQKLEMTSELSLGNLSSFPFVEAEGGEGDVSKGLKTMNYVLLICGTICGFVVVATVTIVLVVLQRVRANTARKVEAEMALGSRKAIEMIAMQAAQSSLTSEEMLGHASGEEDDEKEEEKEKEKEVEKEVTSESCIQAEQETSIGSDVPLEGLFTEVEIEPDFTLDSMSSQSAFSEKMANTAVSTGSEFLPYKELRSDSFITETPIDVDDSISSFYASSSAFNASVSFAGEISDVNIESASVSSSRIRSTNMNLLLQQTAKSTPTKSSSLSSSSSSLSPSPSQSSLPPSHKANTRVKNNKNRNNALDSSSNNNNNNNNNLPNVANRNGNLTSAKCPRLSCDESPAAIRFIPHPLASPSNRRSVIAFLSMPIKMWVRGKGHSGKGVCVVMRDEDKWMGYPMEKYGNHNKKKGKSRKNIGDDEDESENGSESESECESRCESESESESENETSVRSCAQFDESGVLIDEAETSRNHQRLDRYLQENAEFIRKLRSDELSTATDVSVSEGDSSTKEDCSSEYLDEKEAHERKLPDYDEVANEGKNEDKEDNKSYGNASKEVNSQVKKLSETSASAVNTGIPSSRSCFDFIKTKAAQLPQSVSAPSICLEHIHCEKQRSKLHSEDLLKSRHNFTSETGIDWEADDDSSLFATETTRDEDSENTSSNCSKAKTCACCIASCVSAMTPPISDVKASKLKKSVSSSQIEYKILNHVSNNSESCQLHKHLPLPPPPPPPPPPYIQQQQPQSPQTHTPSPQFLSPYLSSPPPLPFLSSFPVSRGNLILDKNKSLQLPPPPPPTLPLPFSSYQLRNQVFNKSITLNLSNGITKTTEPDASKELTSLQVNTKCSENVQNNANSICSFLPPAPAPPSHLVGKQPTCISNSNYQLSPICQNTSISNTSPTSSSSVANLLSSFFLLFYLLFFLLFLSLHHHHHNHHHLLCYHRNQMNQLVHYPHITQLLTHTHTHSFTHTHIHTHNHNHSHIDIYPKKIILQQTVIQKLPKALDLHTFLLV